MYFNVSVIPVHFTLVKFMLEHSVMLSIINTLELMSTIFINGFQSVIIGEFPKHQIFVYVLYSVESIWESWE